MLEDERLVEDLLTTVRSLLTDSDGLEQMRAQSRALARPDAAERLATQLRSLVVEGAV